MCRLAFDGVRVTRESLYKIQHALVKAQTALARKKIRDKTMTPIELAHPPKPRDTELSRFLRFLQKCGDSIA
jgi:hypothetical protein